MIDTSNIINLISTVVLTFDLVVLIYFHFFKKNVAKMPFLKTFANVSPRILGEKCIDCTRSTKIMS